jgi:hypothetical protein
MNMNPRQVQVAGDMLAHTATSFSIRQFALSQSGRAALCRIGMSVPTASVALGAVYGCLIAYDIYR